MSIERIDHAKEARRRLYWLERAGEHAVPLAHRVAAAQVHATLALVEQQRIANLIELAQSHGTTGGSAEQALYALTGSREYGAWGSTAHMSLRPEIAAALGIKVAK